MSNNIYIYHSADFDGIGCREVARQSDPDGEFIGWNHGDDLIELPELPIRSTVYIMDLPPICLKDWKTHDVIWIDHHKSAIAEYSGFFTHSKTCYLIDGVAACRLAYQWLNHAPVDGLPTKPLYIDRQVQEPLLIRLLGEYDIWDKRDPRAETLQFGLRARRMTDTGWQKLLNIDARVKDKIEEGELLQGYQALRDASLMHNSYLIDFEGLKFRAINAPSCNSITFRSVDFIEEGHDALLTYCRKKGQWTVTMYHAQHATERDLSKIAVKHGGGGHAGACGFSCDELPFPV